MVNFMFNLFARIRFVNKHLSKLQEIYSSTQQLIGPKALLLMTLLSIISWYFECIAFYAVLVIFGADVSMMWCTFVYSFATIAGALSMLPGGLGVTEGSLTLFMVNYGIPEDISVIATFIIRIVTLWFAIILGIFALLNYQKKIGEVKLDNLNNSAE